MSRRAHFSDWAFLGLASTASWGMNDITSQYLLEGLRGGLLTLVLFVLIFVFAFRNLARMCRAAQSKGDLALCWALGVGSSVHCVNFIGVSYFGQDRQCFLWLHLGIVGSLTPTMLRREPSARPQGLTTRSSHRLRLASPAPALGLLADLGGAKCFNPTRCPCRDGEQPCRRPECTN